jgi:hypothetical protein
LSIKEYQGYISLIYIFFCSLSAHIFITELIINFQLFLFYIVFYVVLESPRRRSKKPTTFDIRTESLHSITPSQLPKGRFMFDESPASHLRAVPRFSEKLAPDNLSRPSSSKFVSPPHTYIHIRYRCSIVVPQTFLYIYIYICMCVCVCIRYKYIRLSHTYTHAHYHHYRTLHIDTLC